MTKGLYKHHKGRIYRLINTATNCETKEQYAIYESSLDGKTWCRPLKEFKEKFTPYNI